MWDPFPVFDYLDVDECKGNSSCHENAKCTNTNGSHVCECQHGYKGNGQNCTGEFDVFCLVLETFTWIGWKRATSTPG